MAKPSFVIPFEFDSTAVVPSGTVLNRDLSSDMEEEAVKSATGVVADIAADMPDLSDDMIDPSP